MSLSTNNTYQVDLSELEGRKFTCVDGCGLCCLCQPELLEQEVPYFRKNYPNRLVAKRQPHRHFALSMKKKVGSCSFLNDRRCDVYNVRPHFCRQFPFHIHVGTRVQVELDMSCRGVWLDKGDDCATLGAQMVAENDRPIKQAFPQSSEVYRQYYRNCMDMECDCRPQELRDELAPRLGKFNDLNFIASLLEASAEEEELDLQTLKVQDMDSKKLLELEEAAMEAAKDSLGTADPFDAPIYCAEDNVWNIFPLRGREHREVRADGRRGPGPHQQHRAGDDQAHRPHRRGPECDGVVHGTSEPAGQPAGERLLPDGRVCLRGLHVQHLLRASWPRPP